MSVTPKRKGLLERSLSLEPRDPNPIVDAALFWRGVTQACTIVIGVVVIGVVLHLARSLLLPIVCAVAVGLTVGPAVGRLKARGIPEWLSALVVVVGLVGVMNGAVVLLAAPVRQMMTELPQFGAKVADKLHIFDRVIESFKELQSSIGIDPSGQAVDVNMGTLITGVLTTVTPAALSFLLGSLTFLVTLFFIILGRSSFRKYAVNLFNDREARLRSLKILNDIEENLGGYLLVVTAINVSLGIVAAIVAYALGLPAPILWGTLACVLNYVPYVGPGIMHVLLFSIGLVVYPTLLGALIPPLTYIGITIVEGQFLTPAIVGHRVLNLHPLAIFLSIAFWAWLWGPLGALLATPILVMARVALAHLYPSQKADIPG